MCESERASYHPAPAWNDHYKRGGERPPSDDEIGEGREGEREREREGFSIIHSGQRERKNERSGLSGGEIRK